MDIRLLGAIFHEVVTGSKCSIDCYSDNDSTDDRVHRPKGSTLPSNDYLWLGSIIDDCWTGKLHSASCLLQAFNTVCLHIDQEFWTWGQPLRFYRMFSGGAFNLTYAEDSGIDQLAAISPLMNPKVQPPVTLHFYKTT